MILAIVVLASLVVTLPVGVQPGIEAVDLLVGDCVNLVDDRVSADAIERCLASLDVSAIEVPNEWDSTASMRRRDRGSESSVPDSRDAITSGERSEVRHIAGTPFTNEAIGTGGGLQGGAVGYGWWRAPRGQSGGGTATENALLVALRWLELHQDADGKWDGDGFNKHDPPRDLCTGASKMTWIDPGLTGLATLAFLGAGHTHRYGLFRATVKKAVRYLIEIQAANGRIGDQRGHYLYNHAICALALAEAYGMTRSQLLRGPATRAIRYLIAARNPGLAWRYGERDGDNDISVTSWCVMAIKVATLAKLDVAGLDLALAQSLLWIESVTDAEYGVSGYKARPPRGWPGPAVSSNWGRTDELAVNTATTHAASHTPTAIATLCRAVLGYQRDDPRLANGATVVSQMPPVWDTGGGGKLSKVDFYYWYYGTRAMFQVGGEPWKHWNKCMKKALVEHQVLRGSARGSWDPVDAWGASGGRVYATAINALTLETYYTYSPMIRDRR